jgi:nitroreductase
MIHDLIKKRRSVFPAQYNDKPITRDILEQVLEAANWAPTHKRTEPWRFRVLQGKALEQLGKFLQTKYLQTVPEPKQFKAKKLLENPQKAGAIIAICMQRDLQERVPEWEEIAATAMAVQNMWLQCTDLGIGAYWSSPGLIRYMDAFFDLSEGERCLGFFYMGHYNEHPEPGPRSPISEKTVWV